MQATSGISRFEQFLSQPGVRHASSRCLVQVRGADGEQFVVRKPQSPPGIWAKLVGSVIYAKMHGSVAYREGRMERQKATLDQFKQGMEQAYGRDVAREATRSLGSRCLTVGKAREALAAAKTAVEQLESNLKAFTQLLMLKVVSRQVSSGRPDAGQWLAPPCGDTLARLLGQATLGPTLLRGPLHTRPTQQALARAVDLLRALQATPGMSPQRAVEILKFAILVPGDAVAAAKDLCKAPSERQAFDERGVARGARLGPGLVGPDFQPAGSSQFITTPQGELALDPHACFERHALLLKNFGPKDLADAGSHEGRPQRLHEGALKDSNRSNYVVGGTPLPRDKDAFPAAFRARFPLGPKGDALSTLASACANQFNVHPIVGQVSQATMHALVKEDESTLHEVCQRPDGNWSVRCTYRVQFTKAAVEETVGGAKMHQMVDMAPESASLHTVEFLIVPGYGEGDPPRLHSVHTDVVFTGARAHEVAPAARAAQPAQAAQAS